MPYDQAQRYYQQYSRTHPPSFSESKKIIARAEIIRQKIATPGIRWKSISALSGG
jgi:hypothetical protein